MVQPFLLSGDISDPLEWIRHHCLDNIHTPWAKITIPGLSWAIPVTNFSIMAVLSGLVVFALAYVAGRRPSGSLIPRGVLQNAGESLVVFVRDEFVRPGMGHHGDKYLPFFCTLFSFIFVTNLLGMVPIPMIGGTATSNLGMTGMLAISVLLVSIIGGIRENGVGGFIHSFIPPGLPVWLVPLLFVLELAGFFIKHGVLAIRLFANMIAGHLVVGAFLGLIFVAKAYWVAAPSVLLALFVNVLELLVCFLQAYVFTLLASLFVSGTVHPEH